MIEKIENLLQEVIELAADQTASPHGIHAKGFETKKAIWDEIDSLQLAINIVDGIVPYKASGLPWTNGWTRFSITGTKDDAAAAYAAPMVEAAVHPTAAMRSRRIRRVLSLADAALQNGTTSLTTDEIAKILRSEGDTTATRSLHTAVGNILNRTGNWKRVRTGEYEYHAEGVM